MLLPIIILFVLTASGGAFLLSYVLTNKETPKGVALIHGGFAAISVVLLAVFAYHHPHVWPSLVVFIMAAMGGLYMFARDIGGKGIPKCLGMAHGLIALTGLVLLIVLGFGYLTL